MCWLDKWQGATLSPHDNSNLLFEIILSFFWSLGLPLPRNRLGDRIWVQAIHMETIPEHTGRRSEEVRQEREWASEEWFSGQGSQSPASCGAWYLTSSPLLLPGWGLLPHMWVLWHVWFALLKAWIKALSQRCRYWQHGFPAQGEIQGVWSWVFTRMG